MANSEKQHKEDPAVRALPDEVRAPLTDRAKEKLKEIERRLPAWKRRSILRAALEIGLRKVDEAPADALAEFGR